MANSTKLKILIVRLGAMGDVTHVLPSLRLLRTTFPSSEISWAVEEEFAPILEANLDLDKIISLPRKRWQRNILKMGKVLLTIKSAFSFFKNLRQKNYDLVIDFHGNLRSGLFVKLMKGNLKIGFRDSKEFNHIFLNRRISTPKGVHKIEKNLSLIQTFLSLPPSPPPIPQIPIDKKSRVFVENWLVTLPPKKPLIVFHPGVSHYGRIKQWRVENYLRLMEMLESDCDPLMILSFGPQESESVKFFKSSNFVYPLPRLFSLKELMALLSKADLVISCDTGPLHLATALMKPLVGIYGPKSPKIYGPYFSGSVASSQSCSCVPCNLRVCPHKKEISPCMDDLSPEDVYERVKKELELNKRRKLWLGSAL